MFNMVKEAAGIHFSSFKDESESQNPEFEGDEMLSNMKVPPDLIAKFAGS